MDAVVVSLKSRSIPAGEAVALSRGAHRWLKARGADRVLFKVCSIFDSTEHGNIGLVTDALREDAGGGIVMVTPAFPETSRTVYMGHLFVGAVPLHESPLKDHPLNPMRDPNLVRVLEASRGLGSAWWIGRRSSGARRPSAHVSPSCPGRNGRRDRRCGVGRRPGDRRCRGGRPVSTGASGLGLGIARAPVASGELQPRSGTAEEVVRPVGGAAAVVAGSCSRATLEQLALAEASMPVLRLDPGRLLGDAGEVDRALAFARERLGDGPVAIASSATPECVASLQERHGREVVSHRIERAMAEISARLVEAGVRRLVVAGGETSGAAVDRLGIPAFLVGPEIAPGVPVLRTAGGTGDAMLVALKSGNFGGPDFFVKALGLMR